MSILPTGNQPLGSYLRPGRNDHLVLQQLVSEGLLQNSGLVVDPTLIDRQSDLVAAADRHKVETVLDPRSMDLASEHAFDLSGVADLPWASSRPHRPDNLGDADGLLFAESIAGFAIKEGVQSVLAPTHALEDDQDEWLAVDAELVRHLRRALDSRNHEEIPIYYPLAIRSTKIASDSLREKLRDHLAQLPIDGIWLRIHPFGTTSAGPVALRRYIDICQDFHSLGLPLIAERTGTVGVALMAFGAVGGIESGVTLGERFSLDRYTRAGSGKGFAHPPRPYLDRIGAFMKRDQARSFFSHPGMRAAFGCHDQDCCRRGYEEMIDEPRRHFLIQRSREVRRLSHTPLELRASLYLDDFLRPASDAAVRAEKAEPSLARTRKRLDSWRGTLGTILVDEPPRSFSLPPVGRLT